MVSLALHMQPANAMVMMCVYHSVSQQYEDESSFGKVFSRQRLVKNCMARINGRVNVY